jgi:hypothetical protein
LSVEKVRCEETFKDFMHSQFNPEIAILN